jgi:hypothetical protein
MLGYRTCGSWEKQQVPPLRSPGFPVEIVALINFLRLSEKKHSNRYHR